MQQTKTKYNFRILDNTGRVLYIGGNSWMTLEEAQKIVNRANGETIYQYSEDGLQKLWEVL